MEVDQEDESADTLYNNSRQQQLGFKPQKEIYYNKHLPISQNVVDDESAKMLKIIKEGLGKSISCSEISPGVGIYGTKLLT